MVVYLGGFVTPATYKHTGSIFCRRQLYATPGYDAIRCLCRQIRDFSWSGTRCSCLMTQENTHSATGRAGGLLEQYPATIRRFQIDQKKANSAHISLLREICAIFDICRFLLIHNHKDKENFARNHNNLPYEQMITL